MDNAKRWEVARVVAHGELRPAPAQREPRAEDKELAKRFCRLLFCDRFFEGRNEWLDYVQQAVSEERFAILTSLLHMETSERSHPSIVVSLYTGWAVVRQPLITHWVEAPGLLEQIREERHFSPLTLEPFRNPRPIDVYLEGLPNQYNEIARRAFWSDQGLDIPMCYLSSDERKHTQEQLTQLQDARDAASLKGAARAYELRAELALPLFRYALQDRPVRSGRLP